MKHSLETRAEAARRFEMGYGRDAVSAALGLSHHTVQKWLYTYKALGKEALFVTKHNTYSHEVKVAAARAVVGGAMSKPEALAAFGIKSITALERWCRDYRDGGPDALLPKPKGRPRGKDRVFASREEELEARVQELELELEIQKRINALADEIEQERRTR